MQKCKPLTKMHSEWNRIYPANQPRKNNCSHKINNLKDFRLRLWHNYCCKIVRNQPLRMAFMDVQTAKGELRRMFRGDLLRLVAEQRISNCVVNGGWCCFHVQYKELNFCVSEILKEGCQFEKLRNIRHDEGDVPPCLPSMQEMGASSPEKKTNEFGVYSWNRTARSFFFLGKVIERRKKERGNNLKDLLKKAIMDFADRVKDPSTIFLLGT
jgi:hypothetical protein